MYYLRESNIDVFTALQALGGFARCSNLKDEICRPSMSASTRPMLDDLSESIQRPESRNISSAQLDAHPIGIIGKLAVISELALRLEKFRSSYIVDSERERARRAKKMEAVEKRVVKITTENLDRILNVENKLDKVQTMEAKPAPRALNYAEAPAKPKPLAVAASRVPDPEIRSEVEHTLIVFSRCENYTAEPVVAEIARCGSCEGSGRDHRPT
ncbi:hypothetical protein EVAR_50883_1 [Eumeta japonica]|uniref:Uncharacterized protein n=1 Tax=Eumeta variegata TaxID=151549 RepID=A0A4C1Y4G1_EUMVA|nr:hypothetical protein EVAR_50883_1 [Eumeta japonica]